MLATDDQTGESGLLCDDGLELPEPHDFTLDELRAALEQQLDAHGFRKIDIAGELVDTHERTMAAAVARNAQMALFLELRNALASIARLRSRVAELERR